MNQIINQVDNQVSLIEVLRARDKRFEKQKRLIHLYKQTLIVLTLNIPGPQKVNDQINKVFEEAHQNIMLRFQQVNKKVIYRERHYSKTGNEAYFIVRENANIAKKCMIELENNHPLGRLFDIDVFSSEMELLSRSTFGIESRKCFACDSQAVECSRSKKHTDKEIQEALEVLLDKCI